MVAKMRAADDGGQDRGEHDRAERRHSEIAHDNFEGKERAGDRGVEHRSNAAGDATPHQGG